MRKLENQEIWKLANGGELRGSEDIGGERKRAEKNFGEKRV